MPCSDPATGFTDATALGTGIGMEGIAGAAFEDQIAFIIQEASDADLVAGYQRAAKQPGDFESVALVQKIERRNLDV